MYITIKNETHACKEWDFVFQTSLKGGYDRKLGHICVENIPLRMFLRGLLRGVKLFL